jgi:hypothetical protein
MGVLAGAKTKGDFAAMEADFGVSLAWPPFW